MNRLLQHWVHAQAERQPDAIAVVLGNQVLTYGQLEWRSNQLARMLKSSGCRRGDRVAFAIPKSPAAIVSMIGILKADCIHVPIDTASPPARVRKILQSSSPSCVLATEATARLVSEAIEGCNAAKIGVGWIEGTPSDGEHFTTLFHASELDGCDARPLPYLNSEQDAAHILYTSGSTGDPKGVIITHCNVLHFVDWATGYFGMNSSDRVSGHSPLHFDLSTFDVFGAFAAGAQLHLVPPDLPPMPNDVAAFIRNSELTQWFSVPSVLHYMAKFDVVRFNDFPCLKRLLWCGEVFPTPALRYWMQRLPRVSFTNLYGPTEATIASSYYTVPACPKDNSTVIPIGFACEGEQLLVLDAELRPVPAGTTGDLYIAGTGLSPGYWQDPEKTSRAFASDSRGGGRIYRTGDLARIGPDGSVYYVGRSDSQIKSRGYRIELGEVEAALNSLDAVQECAVVAVPTDGFEGTLICAAYVLNADLTTNLVRANLSRLLPSYMLPARWLCLDRLPKNANGKIDRPRIRDLFARNPNNQAAALAAVSPARVSADLAD